MVCIDAAAGRARNAAVPHQAGATGAAHAPRAMGGRAIHAGPSTGDRAAVEVLIDCTGVRARDAVESGTFTIMHLSNSEGWTYLQERMCHIRYGRLHPHSFDTRRLCR